MMLMSKPILIDQLLTIDKTGMPAAPSITQLLDKDVRLLLLEIVLRIKKCILKKLVLFNILLTLKALVLVKV